MRFMSAWGVIANNQGRVVRLIPPGRCDCGVNKFYIYDFALIRITHVYSISHSFTSPLSLSSFPRVTIKV
ncbi:unnamed protein product [Arabis nemorensis]|uniref:Uncharacterized protein n=1 Tax=Arabis nemorensis TaxID=586526 RepID=A0A565CKI1_9BRAS|nr:unnamed protein product [Arabis nemorensis]